MPFLPHQNPVRERRIDVNAFGGYRHDHRAGADRFFEMENMSSDCFPLLTVRKHRKEVQAISGNANGIFAKGELGYVDGTSLYYGGELVGTVADSPKTFIGMGSKVLIWPDKLAFDTEAKTLTPLGASFTTSGTVTISLCDSDGSNFATAPTVSATKPTSATGGALWIDTSDTPHVLKKYSANTGRWTTVETVYLKISHAGIGAGFKAGDGVQISGCTETSLNSSFVLQAVEANYVVIVGILDATHTQTAALTVARVIPDLDFLCEHNNRIWGCSSARHEIRCCKLGDPTNWECFQGISTDSFTLTIGSDGDFTGCAAYGGNVVFFKNGRIEKVMGVKPEQYTLSSVECNGVAAGSAKSLIVANETLYYYSAAGICAYSGAIPSLIGEDLGGPFSAAVAGATASKYFVSMKDAGEDWHLFVYDTRRGTWHREDATQAVGFARIGAQLYMLDAASKKILAIDDESGEGNTPIRWMFETGELIQEPCHIYPQKLIVRAEADFLGDIRVMLRYNGSLNAETVGYINVTRKQVVSIPIRIRRCDSLSLRLEGTRDFTLHGLSFMMVDGGQHGKS